jgi:hypothetical protein
MTNNKQQTAINAVEYLDKVNQFAKENNTGKPKQQTAIEWLVEQFKEYDFADVKDTENYIIKMQSFVLTEKLDKAKEIEKEQQEKLSASWAKSREQTREIAMHIGFAKGFMSGIDCYEDYYEELIGTQLDEEDFTRNYITDRFEETYGGGEQ